MCPATAPCQDLAAAKDLYSAAKYEEALGVLDRLKEAKPTEPDAALGIEQYRALCLLALNRKAEAEQAIGAIADLDPFFQPAEDDAAPWVRAAFKEARRKVLPAALQRLYAHAKELYNAKQMAQAVAAFTLVMKILDDPDLAMDKAATGDMKMVTQGFLDLAQAAAAAAARPTPPAAPATVPAGSAAPPSAVPPAPPARDGQGAGQVQKPAPQAGASAGASPSTGAVAAQDGPVIYDATSKDVVPPLPVRREVPTSTLGPRVAPGAAVVVEIVVRETGTIESVVLRQSAGKYYDETVSQAARNWVYRPAMKAGQPVKYRLLVKVVIGRTNEPPPDDDHAR